MEHIIEIRWDDEASVWFAICNSIPLALESASFDDLIERVKTIAPEILMENNIDIASSRLYFRAERRESIA